MAVSVFFCVLLAIKTELIAKVAAAIPLGICRMIDVNDYEKV